MSNSIAPIVGCQVTVGNDAGTVVKVNKSSEVTVATIQTRQGQVLNCTLDRLRSGFHENMEVEHHSYQDGSISLGLGIVRKLRTLAEHDQVLVEFYEYSDTRWVPFQTLKWTKSAFLSISQGRFGKPEDSEKFRLRTLAHAIENWQENTGSLSKLDIDPLPHQVHLVHHILNSGNFNWLIADDVGLGKTIETGMLIRALKYRGRADRILLVTPAGLTKQWQEEMRYKFDLDAFRIFGDQFSIEEAREWKMYDHVIASVDRLKDEKHLSILMQEGYWDLVIFDEAHRLSRRQYGMKLESSERYRLAQNLRMRAKAMVLLTATPHQGQQDKFVGLLELLRPDRKEDLQLLSLQPQILNDMVYRNNKSDVTDTDGNFIFKGKTVKTIQFDASEEMLTFDRALQRYLREGYAAGKAAGVTGNAIGFVMTVYRKLASSSVHAIYSALERRRERLVKQASDSAEWSGPTDERFAGEFEESIQPDAKEFFEGELEMLEELIVHCKSLYDQDEKLDGFVQGLLSQVLANNPQEKVLIFSEYRSTQDYLQKVLAKQFGTMKVELINGSMDQPARRAAIKRFEGDGQFLISTEAGGEGINLQRNCHIIVNFDLPWNPMRLIQRIGRLYRYGQDKHVLVFNVQSKYSLDDNIVDQMYTKLNQVAQDLATVGSEFNERLHEDVLGELSDLVDVSEILEQAATQDISRTEERIDDALKRAKDAYSLQHELFQHVQGYSSDRLNDKLVIEPKHTASFIDGMLDALRIENDKTRRGLIWNIHFSEAQMHKVSVAKRNWRFTLDKALAAQYDDVDLLETEHFFFRYLLDTAKSAVFGGRAAPIASIEAPESGVLAGAYNSWVDASGQRRARQFNLWRYLHSGKVSKNPPGLLDKLALGVESSKDTELQQDVCRRAWGSISDAAYTELHKQSGNDQFPENFELATVAKFEK